jgi:NADP-dependent 3-hydroxy acid dehydrogenase YdfG
MPIEGKVVFITGASSGIGFSTAELLAKQGAKVVATARREERLKELAQKVAAKGFELEYKVLDVTDKEAVKKAVDDTVEKYGKIDVIFNNAGLMPLSFMENIHTEEWERMVDVNIKGVLWGIAAALPHMLKQNSGHIFNTSSIAGHKLFPGGGVYCGTKFAVRAISEGLREELHPKYNIRISTISPGPVATELTHTITDENIIERFKNRKGIVEPLTAEEVADAIIYAINVPDSVDINDIVIRPTSSNV